MNIVLTCGHPHSGIQSVHALLVEAGLSEPGVSRRAGMGVPEFHQRVLTAHGIDLTIPTSLAPVTPGRVWEGLAVDLILGNLDAPNWGWADPGAVWLLDFWSQIDPRIRFVLVYATPERVVAEMLRQGALSPDAVAQAIASWVAYHAELLRFFHRHRDRCILVDFTAATSNPRRLVTKVVDGLGLCLDPSRVVPEVASAPQSVLEALLVGGLLPQDTEAGAIYAELEGTADLSNDSDALPPNLVQAWGEYGQILARLDEGAKEAQRLRETTTRLEREGAVTEAKRAEADAKATAAAAENEILLLQVHQTLEELEQYYLRCQTLEEAEKQRQTLETTLATERAKQTGLANEIKLLQARVAQGEAAAKQLAAAEKELAGQVAGRKQVEQLLGEAARRTEDISRELIAAKSAHSATETRIREQLNAALADERAKQAELRSEITRLKAQMAQGETAAKQLIATQKELNGQTAARRQAEQLLAEAARRTEDVARELTAAQAAQSATEETLRRLAANEIALTQETELLRLKSQQDQDELQRCYQTIDEAHQVRQHLQANLTDERARQGRLENLAQEKELLLLQLQQVQDELKESHLRFSQAQTSAKQLADKQSALGEKALRQEAEKRAALKQENELLLDQLKQVQNELKRTHLQARNAADLRASASLPSGVTLKQLTQATVDLRGEINGDNWYDAEQDGRWAGPGQVSTLVLPALAVGRYQLALEVVDAIAPDVLNGMMLSLNGKPLAIKRSHRGSLTRVTAQFSSETSAPGEQWKLELSFPRLMSPAEKGSDDHRALAVRVRTLSIVPVGADSDWPGAEASASGKLGSMRPTQIRFDLRGDIDGDNWYDAEHDGRWAGPDQVSSLILPALGVGRYQMELEVVDAMAPEIVNGMALSLNGKPLTVNPNCRGYPTLVTAEFSADTPAPDGQWELGITFPRLVSPADQGSDDRRTLAIRLRTISLQEILPDARVATVPRSRKKASAARGDRKSYRWWGSKK